MHSSRGYFKQPGPADEPVGSCGEGRSGAEPLRSSRVVLLLRRVAGCLALRPSLQAAGLPVDQRVGVALKRTRGLHAAPERRPARGSGRRRGALRLRGVSRRPGPQIRVLRLSGGSQRACRSLRGSVHRGRLVGEAGAKPGLRSSGKPDASDYGCACPWPGVTCGHGGTKAACDRTVSRGANRHRGRARAWAQT